MSGRRLSAHFTQQGNAAAAHGATICLLTHQQVELGKHHHF